MSDAHAELIAHWTSVIADLRVRHPDPRVRVRWLPVEPMGRDARNKPVVRITLELAGVSNSCGEGEELQHRSMTASCMPHPTIARLALLGRYLVYLMHEGREFFHVVTSDANAVLVDDPHTSPAQIRLERLCTAGDMCSLELLAGLGGRLGLEEPW